MVVQASDLAWQVQASSSHQASCAWVGGQEAVEADPLANPYSDLGAVEAGPRQEAFGAFLPFVVAFVHWAAFLVEAFH